MFRKLALLLCTLSTVAASAQTIQIQVDLDKPLGADKPITSWFGYDESNYTTMTHGRELLRELHDTSPVPVYIRAHHLLTSGDGVPELKWSSTNVYTLDAKGHPVYDFKIIDGIFDAYQQAGVRPMVELGFMPEALASGPAPYKVSYPRTLDGSVQSPPKDYAAWGELCRTLAAHLVARYGHDQAAQWYWEVWNEPNIPYWHGTQQEYDKLYDFAVAGVRAALPEARVGGPATTSPRDPKAVAFLNAFLQHVAHDKSAANGQPIPLDFISFHAKGEPKIIDGHVRMGLDKELRDADKGFAAIADYPQFRNLPIILSEADPEGCAACSAKENPANNYRNGTLYPAYTAAALKGLFDLQDRHQVNLLAMLSWSFEFEGKDYFQGFRTLATNGIDKPIMNVFRMAGLMSGQRVATTSTGQIPLDQILSSGVQHAPDIDALATHADRSAAILLWNYQDDDLPAADAPTSVTVHGIPADVHRVLLQHDRIDATHSNAYTTWKAMGSPQQPTPAQYAQLKAAGQLQSLTSPEWLDVTSGSVMIPLTLPRQALSLLRLSW
ncbi:GH39 family glycosyl hydrolase [Granulicella mallensis]|uniref:Xylan 1,4-beta-xylosidase n=1 Tax=Granulicella mallensis (strain ATCC BAA-1857 / DSM 23137 / MP5ACTX8) TaxID=682795 RepID=G8NT02_GRAMM|nr:beta-xylosidase [Granulicella mallensis]AEU36345.1 Xylan 1,4-beta-xylosidase [Granulicella mallensis MP5ACTX8]